jgi:hypothetical protein
LLLDHHNLFLQDFLEADLLEVYYLMLLGDHILEEHMMIFDHHLNHPLEHHLNHQEQEEKLVLLLHLHHHLLM